MLRALLLLALIAPALPVLAQDTPKPRERPAATTQAPPVPLPRIRPEPSSSGEESAASSASSEEPASSSSEEPSSSSLSSSEEPSSSSSSEEPSAPPKPPRDYQVACPAVMNGSAIGKALPPVHEGQCGLQSPLSIEAVSANGRTVDLNAAVVTDCGMATQLPDWVAEVDSYIFAHDKTRIKTVNLSTNYMCRNVDNAKEGNLSFHAFADALDVIGFTLEDGRSITISPGYNGTPEQGSQILHFARDAACTRFMTVLGPESDSFHQDNMHIDLGCHGKTCTARICE